MLRNCGIDAYRRLYRLLSRPSTCYGEKYVPHLVSPLNQNRRLLSGLILLLFISGISVIRSMDFRHPDCIVCANIFCRLILLDKVIVGFATHCSYLSVIFARGIIVLQTPLKTNKPETGFHVLSRIFNNYFFVIVHSTINIILCYSKLNNTISKRKTGIN